MQAAPFDVQSIIARLVATVPVLRKVAGAADFATVTKLADFVPPCAYVLLAREKAEANKPGNVSPGAQVRVRQRAIVTFGVVIAVRNYRQQLGAQSADTLQSIVGAVRQSLIGYFQEYRTLLAALIQRGCDQGEFRPVDAEQTAIAFIALLEGVTLLWAVEPDGFDVAAQARAAVRLLLAGIVASDSGPPPG